MRCSGPTWAGPASSTSWAGHNSPGSRGSSRASTPPARGPLEQLRRWIAEIQDIAPGAPVVLLANKSDMGSWRKIEDAAIESFAKEVGAPWYLTSAKTGENVDKAFLDVASAIRRNQRMSVPRAC